MSFGGLKVGASVTNSKASGVLQCFPAKTRSLPTRISYSLLTNSMAKWKPMTCHYVSLALAAIDKEDAHQLIIGQQLKQTFTSSEDKVFPAFQKIALHKKGFYHIHCWSSIRRIPVCTNLFGKSLRHGSTTDNGFYLPAQASLLYGLKCALHLSHRCSE